MANDEHANWWLATCPETPHLITSTAPLPERREPPRGQLARSAAAARGANPIKVKTMGAGIEHANTDR
jgi:hypothetical protein